MPLVPLQRVFSMTSISSDNGAKPRCNKNTMNVTHLIETLMVGYDRHYLPAPDGVNVTMEIHVQVKI